MFLLAHLGIGLGLAWLLAWKSPARFDYRLVLFGSILPDLIDKPLGYALGLETRIWSHTFVFLFAILAVSFAPNLWSLRFIGFGVATHLLVDRIWEMPWVVLYPAYGWSFHPASQDAEHWIATLLHDPLVQAGEIVGACPAAGRISHERGYSTERSRIPKRSAQGQGTRPEPPSYREKSRAERLRLGPDIAGCHGSGCGGGGNRPSWAIRPAWSK
ncbi:MAG: metal-dependent hydrolase [Methanobacteriota archaeon]|nr:MAG: metal-dependent hydrolase [Euryarchaeota archaeon]